MLDTGGDVTYEQLECVGLDNNVSNLVASFGVKLPYGYNGGLCQAGSTEYVAFWASGWDDSCGWTYLCAEPVWGNILDSHVQVGPGPVVEPGTVTPLIGVLGRPADPDGLGRPCPFAATVIMQGPPFPGYQYRIQVKRATDVNWTTVNNS